MSLTINKIPRTIVRPVFAASVVDHGYASISLQKTIFVYHNNITVVNDTPYQNLAMTRNFSDR